MCEEFFPTKMTPFPLAPPHELKPTQDITRGTIYKTNRGARLMLRGSLRSSLPPETP